jgi:tRNA 2-selenouridine synthase
MTPGHGIVDAATALRNLDSYDTIIDVRSESEYAEDHVPGAINCPVLTDVERTEVGTMDRQQSSFEARRRGAALVARRIAHHLDTVFADKPRDWKPLVYCWRGGNRSGAMTHVLAQIGWRATRISGGYREYRRAVMKELEELPARLRFQVVCGPTGSGKSRLLQHLDKAGAQVLDLEALACHRGSVLGSLPSQPQPGQKYFESMIWDRLRRTDPERPIYVESESRKIGNLRVPDALLACMRDSACILLEVPLGVRVQLLRTEYQHFEQEPVSLMRQLDCLTVLHGHQKVGHWKSLALSGSWDHMVEQLLHEHYDPAYARSIGRNFNRVGAGLRMPITSEADTAYAAAARKLIA